MNPVIDALDTERYRARLHAALGELATLPREPRVRLALAEAEFRLAITPGTSQEEAVERLRTAIAHDPFMPKLYLHLGRQLHRAGQHRAAVSEYRRALRLAPSSRRVHQLLALALLELDKKEQTIGQALVKALNRGSSAELRAAVADLDELIKEQSRDDQPRTGPTSPKRAGAKRKPRPSGAGTRDATSGDADPKRWSDTWRIALVEQLSRPKPLPAQVAAHLDTGSAQARNGGDIAEFATACALTVINGWSTGEVRKRMTATGIDRDPEHPAVAMLTATLDLAESDKPAAFVAAATDRLARRLLPPELVCWLHFARCGPNSGLTAADTVRLLDAYPQGVRNLDCFRELRLAVLDGYARKAWADERFAEAKLLWRETIALDPHRVPVAVNLALLAARTKSEPEYQPAWERLTELLYLHAAGVGDVQLLLDERRSLHLALSQQARQRHCPPTTPNGPTGQELATWVADPDALAIWLREWDLYYLNARLHFRSPTQLLGVPRDAADEDFESARDTLIAHIESALHGRSWAGVEVFRGLAIATVREAFDRAIEPIERARDPYLEPEQERADALAGELLQRALLLKELIVGLIKQKSARNVPLGCSIARHQFLLPKVILEPLCVTKGLLDEDGPKLFDVFENDFMALAARCVQPQPDAETEWSRRLAAMDECVAVLPHRVELLEQRSVLLYKANRWADAYRAALDALERLPSSVADPDEADSLRERRASLVNLIDSAGMLVTPEKLRQPQDVASAKATVVALRDALGQFPRSGALRLSLVNLLVQLDEVDRTTGVSQSSETSGAAEAVKLLSEGIETALSDEQRQEFVTKLKSVNAAAAVASARKRVQRLAEEAVDRVHQEIERFQRQPGPAAAQESLRVVHATRAEVADALAQHRQNLPPDQIKYLEDVLAQFDAIVRQLDNGGE